MAQSYEELSIFEKVELDKLATNFYREHRTHIRNLLKDIEVPIAPSGSDMFHPELWKGIHWLWFIEIIWRCA